MQWGETQTPRAVVPRAFHTTFAQGAIAFPGGWTRRFPPRFLLEQFTADTIENQVTNLTSVTSKLFDSTEFEQGTGTVYFSGWTSKAQSLRLTVLQGDDAPAVLSQPAVEERGA